MAQGVAFCGISALDIALWDLKAKIFGVPLYRCSDHHRPCADLGSGGWTSFSEIGVGPRADGLRRARHSARQMKVAKDFASLTGRHPPGWRPCAKPSAMT